MMALVLAFGLSLASVSSLAAEDKAKPAAKAKPYPLKVCLITDEKLGGMGEVYTFVHEGQEIKLCCKGCLKEFKKEPAKYLKKLAAAEKKAKKSN